MRLRIHQVDAFTGRLFRGNPAAVVLLRSELPDATLQAVAAENNLSETAFVLPLGDRFGLRWFTPAMEVDLCGHATLAAAFVLFESGAAGGASIRFATQSGELRVSRSGELLSLDFPARPAERIADSDLVAAALGAQPAELHAARDLMAIFESEREIAELRPDFARLAALDAFAVAVTAPGREVDFVSRFFAPKAGIPEDPVTGSAHCTLVPYWSRRLGRGELHARQISLRGGELFCSDRGERVTIRGRAVEYLRGEIVIE
jgi:PhzF family phenazine biosynthesis protein